MKRRLLIGKRKKGKYEELDRVSKFSILIGTVRGIDPVTTHPVSFTFLLFIFVHDITIIHSFFIIPQPQPHNRFLQHKADTR